MCSSPSIQLGCVFDQAFKWDGSELRLMHVHGAVAVCFISPALISTCWNNSTCSTASGLYSTPTKSVTLCFVGSASRAPFLFLSLLLFSQSMWHAERAVPNFPDLCGCKRKGRFLQVSSFVGCSLQIFLGAWELARGLRIKTPLCGRDRELRSGRNTQIPDFHVTLFFTNSTQFRQFRDVTVVDHNTVTVPGCGFTLFFPK